MTTGRKILLGFVIIALFVGFIGGFYTSNEMEQVVITRFGKPVGEPITNAGPHWKLPMVDHINRFDKRLLDWNGKPTEISAKDKVFIKIDTYAKWKIIDALKFLRSVRNEIGAQARLDNIIDATTRDFVTSNNLHELVRTSNRQLETAEEELTIKVAAVEVGRDSISNGIRKASAIKMSEYGIELVDVKIKRINYISTVRDKVFERMIAERLRIAEKFRSKGEGEKAKIEGDMEQELQRITSEAYKTAQEIRGRADGQAIKITAEAFEKDPEFYSFVKSLTILKDNLPNGSQYYTTTNSDFFRYLESLKVSQ